MKTLTICLLGITLLVFSCKPSHNNKTKTAVLFTVGPKSVSTDEFEYVYTKNSLYGDSLYNREAVKEYFDLFINFKLKIAKAEALGMDKDSAFIAELNGYKNQLAKPYLTESRISEDLTKEAYERLQSEISAAHILIKMPPKASASDTLKAWNKIEQIRNQALSGEDFAVLAKKYSEDPSARLNAGDLGYFTALQMVYPFEDAAYKTPIGTISEPVRTKFGYHLIKVKDKRPSQGKIKAAHIMIRATSGMKEEDSIRARNKSFEIYKKLQEGADWAEMCRQFSDDFNSRNKEGVLPLFATGNMPPTFEKAAFNLKNKGEISQPIQTAYGWHIIRLLDKKMLESYEKMKAEIQKRVKNDSRASVNETVLLKRLKEENKFTANPETLSQALLLADSTLTSGKWDYNRENKMLKKTLFEISNKEFSLKSFFEYLKKEQQVNKNLLPADYMKQLYKRFEKESILTYEKENLAKKFPEYAKLMNEYREGILLFQLMDEMVWSKAVKDTVGLSSYYQSHLMDYQWKERGRAFIYHASDKEVLEKVKNDLITANSENNNGNNPFNSLKKELENKYNAETPLTLQVEEGLFEWGNGTPKILSKIKKEIGSYELEENGRFYYVVISELLPKSAKRLEEIKGLVISDYQNYLEAQWIDELKKQYPISVNSTELEKVYRRFEKN
ncbi:peptidylprolyl isomerase [Xanthovirga aplysinae]|uniref:peptidylprolyl isomerase n=1 Tax=Xanthovirga aplysinae TaxID=2529853 RepID=UPI0012BC1FAA|nr:peptidylprolyl isomerase [Xanthovirga aplysinae]MTI32079.1 peptidylprolyl isomerase [Xanthovirga aplysinae]